MKKIMSTFLIILIFVAISCLIFHKDYGFDEQPKNTNANLKSIDNIIEPYQNKTIGDVDYLQSQMPVGKFGGSFTTSIMGEPKTFNPYNSSDATSSELSEIMYDGLTQTDASTGKVVPKLAKEIEVQDDTTYIIKLRKGLTWSDGKDITAKDVYFTYNTVIFQGFGNGATRDVMLIDGEVPNIQIIDDYTVKFTTPKPFAPFLRTLSAPILPEHIFKKVTDKGNEYFQTFQGIDTNPKDLVISGAFKLSEYVPSQRVVFTKNPNYYLINKEDKKLPYIDKWINLIVGDTNNDTIKFEAGATDMLNINSALLDRYKTLQKRENFSLYNLGTSTN
ncbi:hypothetical protein IJ670_00725, partial [bacterium]|nr:hypothetical protein [bacterium]